MGLPLIILIILCILLYPLFKAGRTVNRVRKDFQRAFDEQNNPSSHQQGGQGREYDPTTGREKKYTKDEGEYVDFEECTDPVPAEPRHAETTTQYRQEEQISDAEFEEIP